MEQRRQDPGEEKVAHGGTMIGGKVFLRNIEDVEQYRDRWDLVAAFLEEPRIGQPDALDENRARHTL